MFSFPTFTACSVSLINFLCVFHFAMRTAYCGNFYRNAYRLLRQYLPQCVPLIAAINLAMRHCGIPLENIAIMRYFFYRNNGTQQAELRAIFLGFRNNCVLRATRFWRCGINPSRLLLFADLPPFSIGVFFHASVVESNDEKHLQTLNDANANRG